jgi:chain length determinant protein EpsF
MNPQSLLLILRARYKIAIAVAILCLLAGLAANELVPRRYVAETVVMVDTRSPDPVSALFSPAGSGGGSLSTQVDIVKSDRVGRKVVRMLRLDDDPAVKQLWQASTGGKGKLEDWMSSLLRKGVAVNPARDGSSMLTIAYQAGDPVFVAAVANAFAQAYIEASVELKVEPARQYSQWFGDQAKALRENVEKAQAQLSEFQREKGIVAADDSLDNEHAKLRELAGRLTAVQGEIRDAQSKQRAGAADARTMPEVVQNPAVAGVRSSINQLEVKMKEAESNLGVRHPQYLRMASELDELRNRLESETRLATSGFSSSRAVGITRETELKAAIDAQTRKILTMKKERDEIAVLQRDVETAKRAYEAVTARLTQTNLESQATRTNIFVLNPAVEPIEPSFPMPRSKALLIAVAAGILLAGAAVVGLELLDRRIRTANDLAEMLQLPVLAEIGPSRPPRRLPFFGAAKALPSR